MPLPPPVASSIAKVVSAASSAASSSSVLDTLSAIPGTAIATVFGAIAGGIVALFVAARTRAHDARMKAADRKSTWRREVYLDAIDKVVLAIASISRFPDKPINDSGSNDILNEALTALAKVWVVADLPAAKLTRDLNDGLGEQYLRMMVRAITIQATMENVRTLDRRIEFLDAENATAECAFNEAERTGKQTKEVLASWVKVERLKNEANLEQANLRASTVDLRAEFLQTLLERNVHLQDSVTRLAVELRRELEVADPKADELAFFIERQRFTQSRVKDVVDESFDTLRSMVAAAQEKAKERPHEGGP